MDTALQVRGLRKRFVDQPADALVKITMVIRAGSRAAIVGPPRCGKSALLATLAGRMAPSQGWVTVLGQDPFRNADRIRRRVGWIPARSSFPKNLTIRELGELARQLSRCGDPLRFAQLCTAFELDPLTPADSTTGSIHRLVNAALALQKSPSVVLVDSPNDAEDPAADRRFFELLLSNCLDNTAVVFGARRLESVMGFVSEIFLMREGVIVDRCVPSETEPRAEIGRGVLDALPAALPADNFTLPAEMFAVTGVAGDHETART